jgi:hypothetical protein
MRPPSLAQFNRGFRIAKSYVDVEFDVDAEDFSLLFGELSLLDSGLESETDFDPFSFFAVFSLSLRA